jgi:hypothetical protein
VDDLHLLHPAETLAQTPDELRVDFDRADAVAAARKLRGQDAGAGPDVENEVPPAEFGRANHFGGQPGRAEEVLSVATPS